jgi:hypothetical protein
MSVFSTDSGRVTFTDSADGWSEKADSDVSTRGFAGGDGYALSIGGQREVSRSVTMLVDSRDDYRALLRMRAQRGSLQIDDWDDAEVAVVLKSVSPSPPFADGTLLVRCEFVVESDA